MIFMAKCTRCKRGGLFRKLNEQGFCSDCEIIVGLTVERDKLNDELKDPQALYDKIKRAAQDEVTKEADKLLAEKQGEINNATSSLQELLLKFASTKEEYDLVSTQVRDSQRQNELNHKKLEKFKYPYRQISSYFNDFKKNGMPDTHPDNIAAVVELLKPTVELHLQNMNVRDLRKMFKQNEKAIQMLLNQYESRYTTKTNAAIYKLMVIALSAELQNVLFDLNFNRLDISISRIKEITQKYLKICTDGNQTIAPTMQRFISEIENLFIDAIKIEYEYYVKRERIKEEQRALREQMRQEKEERKELARQQKLLEKEKEKYSLELGNLAEQLNEESNESKKEQIECRIEEVRALLLDVDDKREQIINLQNGKAGYVYVISNLGSFGDDVFKIGMTRRLEPLDRVRELGSASVPFPFDVHSLIFSEDAVGLEYSMHRALHEQRVNKINFRKEFFKITMDEIEELVYSLQPSAEFNRTLLALQYNQGLSIDDIPYDLKIDDDGFEDDEDAEDDD